MSRSVSVPSDAEVVAYLRLDDCLDDDLPDVWDMFIEDLTERLTEKYPSLRECDSYLGREEHVILENDLVLIGVSEYCGLVSLWIVPKDSEYDHHLNLAHAWIGQISQGFTKEFSHLTPMGTASNGEQFFRPVDRPEGVVTSKEGMLF